MPFILVVASEFHPPELLKLRMIFLVVALCAGYSLASILPQQFFTHKGHHPGATSTARGHNAVYEQAKDVLWVKLHPWPEKDAYFLTGRITTTLQIFCDNCQYLHAIRRWIYIYTLSLADLGLFLGGGGGGDGSCYRHRHGWDSIAVA